MPISIESLGVAALRILASDLSVTDIGTEKDLMIKSLTDIFILRGFDPTDVTTMATSSKVQLPVSHSPSSFLNLNLRPPSHFDTSEEGRPSRWDMFLKQFNIYAEATGLMDDSRKTSVLLHCAGPNLQLITETLNMPPGTKYSELISALSMHFTPTDVTRFDRFKLYEIFQRPDEGIGDFVTRLRQKSRHCKLVCSSCGISQEDDRLLDVLLRNTRSAILRERVFEKGLTSLSEVLTLGRSLEAASSHSQQMASFLVNKQRHSEVNYAGKSKFSGSKIVKNVPTSKVSPPVTSRAGRKCLFCAGFHPMIKVQCPAFRKTCQKCNLQNHFAKCCESLKARQKSPVHAVVSVASPMTEEYVFHVPGKNQVFCELVVCGIPRKFLIDTGSSYNIIPRSFLLHRQPLQPAPVVQCYGGAKLNHVGCVTLKTNLPGKPSVPVDFLVVDKGQPLLGLQSSISFSCISLNSDHVFSISSHQSSTNLKPPYSKLLEKYALLFDANPGCIKGVLAKIQLKPGSQPVFCRHRPVPLALKHEVSKTLDEMIDRGTLSKVRTSLWASPMVTVPKPDGSVRLCADYTRTLSSVVDIESYPLPHPDELLSSLAGNAFFTKLDLRTCFEQFKLDDGAKELLTVNTIKGLLRYERLPYGISSAPAIVQRAMEDILRGLDVHVYLDDLLIASPDLDTHLIVLENVLKRLTDAGARLRRDKCEFCVSSVRYLGFIISKDGRRVDPAKLHAILDIEPPTDISSLRSFLGLVRFYDKFIPDLATVAAPLHQLLKKASTWQWTSSEHGAFAAIKSILTSAPTLAHYDPSNPVILSCDASPFGVGAILSHRFPDGSERPIAFASRTLSAAEKNYAQIDKEALSLIYGVSKFEKYILARDFILVTDHKPLQAIFSFRKGLPSSVTARLHRYAIRLSSFNFSIEYRDGAKHSNADALSRAPVDDPEISADETELCEVACLQASNLSRAAILNATAADQTLPLVLANIRGGWPEHCPTDDSMKPYWRHRHQLSNGQGIVMLGRRVVIPECLRTQTMAELHDTHQGMLKMKSLARLHVWWPSIEADIELTVNTCTSCQTSASSPSISNHPWPAAQVWERVHLDYGTFNGHDFLVLVDAGSKWIEAKFLNSTTSSTTLLTLYSWFSRFGFPKCLHTDGGPQFTSTEFRNKMADWNIAHSVSPPYHPQSNGMAERAVRLIKEALKKNASSRSRLDAILFRYRATPLSSGRSPSELLLGYNLRSRLQTLGERETETHTITKSLYKPGDPVWIRDYRPNSTKWQEALVHQVLGRAIVEVYVDDRIIKRHINQVRRRTLQET